MDKDTTWVRDLLGKPWVANARGPDTFDCWGLVWWVYQRQLKIELPKFLGINAEEVTRVARQMHRGVQTAPWLAVSQPKHMDLVGMSGNLIIHHVGLYLEVDRGLVLHVASGRSVAAQTISHIQTLGTSTIKYYRHELCHCC
jgi:cell wall-associated NlpC family hydrolase